MKISVCMTTYNGAPFVERQIKSILPQLKFDDELIVVDDSSTDNTCEIITRFCDHRIHLYKNKINKGFLFSFQEAISYSSGEVIFLSDQDDEWMDNKIVSILVFFKEKKADIILHDSIVVDGGGNTLYDSLKELFPMKTGILINLVKNSFTGCCMALRRSTVLELMPIPSSVIYHDRWFGIMGNLLGYKTLYLDKKLIKYCRHENNVSPFHRTKLSHIIKDRIVLIFCLIKFLWFKKLLIIRS